jgi:hypothetical protein
MRSVRRFAVAGVLAAAALLVAPPAASGGLPLCTECVEDYNACLDDCTTVYNQCTQQAGLD